VASHTGVAQGTIWSTTATFPNSTPTAERTQVKGEK
jgi:hypothetical protein